MALLGRWKPLGDGWLAAGLVETGHKLFDVLSQHPIGSGQARDLLLHALDVLGGWRARFAFSFRALGICHAYLCLKSQNFLTQALNFACGVKRFACFKPRDPIRGFRFLLLPARKRHGKTAGARP